MYKDGTTLPIDMRGKRLKIFYEGALYNTTGLQITCGVTNQNKTNE
jgi:hypothetical protein